MMKQLRLFMFVWMTLAAATMLPGCVRDIVPETAENGETVVVPHVPATTSIPYTVTVQGDPSTKMILSSLDGSHLLFESGDRLSIEGSQGSGESLKTISGTLDLVSGSGESSATFRGVLTYSGTGVPDNDFPLTATLLGADQPLVGSGIADDLSTAVHRYCVMSGEGTYGGASFPLYPQTAFITFTIDMNGLSSDGVCRASVSNNAGTDILASGNSVTISSGTSVFTAAVPVPAGGLSLSQALVWVDGCYVKFGGTGKVLQAGKAYTSSGTVSELNIPFTLVAANDETTITLGSNPSGVLKYSLNGGARTAWSGDLEVDAGDVVQWFDDYAGEHGKIYCDKECAAYGNVMSLVNSTTYAVLTEFTEERVFYNLFFRGDPYRNPIVNHPARDIFLPALTLTPYCYFGMFHGTNISEAPVLPAGSAAGGSLATYCYGCMFYDCKSLVTPPELPATTLAPHCYGSMFAYCSNMTTAPALNAMEMKEGCYQNMMAFCNSLVSAPDLPATTAAVQCYSDMFSHCANLENGPTILPPTTAPNYCYAHMFFFCPKLKNAPVLPATEIGASCYEEMFDGCNALEVAPALPALVMKDKCYHGMFVNCSTLTEAPALPSVELADYCYTSMFSGCTGITTAPVLNADVMKVNCYCGMFSNSGLTACPVLPATVLAKGCYSGMFSRCSGITSAPVLGVETLAESCYESMFSYCVNLTAAPELNSMTLAKKCYYQMFRGCTGLSAAPALPATTLAESCYQGMFSGCTGLTAGPVLNAGASGVGSLANSCYQSMFSSCTGLSMAPALPATVLAESCYSSMFSGCTSLTASPELPAPILVTKCYSGMFSRCSSLNYVTCLAEDVSASNCTSAWLTGVASSGTLRCLAGTTYQSGSNGLPSGWSYSRIYSY